MTPSGTICICANTNMKYQSEDTIVFASESAKRTYFDNKVIKTFTNQQYTRANTNGVNSTLNGKLYVAPGTSSIKVDCPIGQIYNADYMFYVDTGYSGRTFYNFITDVSYVSDSVTQITFTEDVFMTWQNGIVMQDSYVERETVSDDTPYSENMEVPDYIIGQYRRFGKLNLAQLNTFPTYACMVINTFVYPTWDNSDHEYIIKTADQTPTDTTPYNSYDNHENRTDNLVYYFFPISSLTSGLNGLLGDILNKSIPDTYQPARDKYQVLSLFTIPKICCPANIQTYLSGATNRFAVMTPNNTWNYQGASHGGGPLDYEVFTYNSSSVYDIVQLQESDFNFNYSPRNNKLKSAPYRYINITNNQGKSINLKPQYFDKVITQNSVSLNIRFSIISTLANFANVNLYPYGYENITNGMNPEYSLSVGEYPELPFSYDKTASAKEARVLTNGLNLIGSVLAYKSDSDKAKESGEDKKYGSQNYINTGIDTFSNIINERAKTKWEEPEVRGLDSSGVVATSNNTIHFSAIGIGLDVASQRAIDDYFTRYGYAINKFKTITLGLNGRKRFYYVKTGECNITGTVPMYAKNYLENMFKRGIRMWSSSYFLENEEDNPIIS